MKIVLVEPFTKEERETHFWHSELDDYWCCETSERKWNTKLKNKGWELIEEGRNSADNWVYSVWKAPTFSLRVRSTEKSQRTMTEEHKAKLLEGLANAKSARQS